MLFTSSLKDRKRSKPAARGRTQTSARQPAGFGPGLEALEERRLMSSAGLHGHGGGSGGGGSGGSFYAPASTVDQLIADINYANNAGGTITITLAPNTTFDLIKANNTTNGANGLPVIGGTSAVNLHILANGDTIGRAGTTSTKAFRLFDVAQGASLTLDNVTLRNGYASGSGTAGIGGAIYNQGTLIINDSNLSGNRAVDNSGISSAGRGATLAITNTTLSGNCGISSQGTLAINGSTLSWISSTASGATVKGSTVSGGISNQGTMTVNDSTLGSINNDLGTMTVNGSACRGGSFNSGNLTLSYSTVSGGFSDYGGGIYNAATLTLSNSTISGNTARYGGGIYNAGGTATILDSTITNNATHHYDYPWSGGYGGGIYNAGGNVVIHNSRIIYNTGDAGDGSDGNVVAGADIYNAAPLTLEDSSSVGDVLNLGAGSLTIANYSSASDVYNFGSLTIINYSSATYVYNVGSLTSDLTSTIQVLS